MAYVLTDGYIAKDAHDGNSGKEDIIHLTIVDTSNNKVHYYTMAGNSDGIQTWIDNINTGESVDGISGNIIADSVFNDIVNIGVDVDPLGGINRGITNNIELILEKDVANKSQILNNLGKRFMYNVASAGRGAGIKETFYYNAAQQIVTPDKSRITNENLAISGINSQPIYFSGNSSYQFAIDNPDYTFIHTVGKEKFEKVIIETSEESEESNWQDNIGNVEEQVIQTTYIAGSFAQKMTDFANMTNAIANRYNNNSPVYTLYLNFKCKGLQLVDTTSTEFSKNNFVKFDIEQKGAGVPNNFKLTILYKIFEDKPLDIDVIDDILLATTSVVDESGNLVTTDTMNNMCEFVYGYGNDPNLRSQTYRGIILDYDQTINHGYLEYNITGTAWVYVANETKFSRKPEHVVGIDKDHPDPFQFLQNFIDTEFSEKSSVSGKRLFGLMFDESAVGGEANNAVPPDYIGAFDDLTNVNNKTLYQIIGDVLAGCIHQKEAEFFKANKNISPTQKQIYSFFVDDTGNSECDNIIWVYKVPSESVYTSNEQEQLKHVDAQITFNWYGHSGTGVNHFVKSWKPSFEGALLLSLACSLQKTGNTYVTLTEEGETKLVKGINSPRLGVKSSDTWATLNTAQEYSRWSAVTQYTYSATLIIQGVPVEVPIGGLIYVNPLWFNKSHHSGGIYFITEKIDNMSSSGYETTLKLVKRCISYDPEPTYIGISGKAFSEFIEVGGVKYRVIGTYNYTVNGDEIIIDEANITKFYDEDGNVYDSSDINKTISGVPIVDIMEEMTIQLKNLDSNLLSDNIKKYQEFEAATDEEKEKMIKEDFDLDGTKDFEEQDHDNDGVYNVYDKDLNSRTERTYFESTIDVNGTKVIVQYYVNRNSYNQFIDVSIKSINGGSVADYNTIVASKPEQFVSVDNIYGTLNSKVKKRNEKLPTGDALSGEEKYVLDLS